MIRVGLGRIHIGNRRGFTIIELLVVVTIVGILAAITVVAYSGVQAEARDSTRKSDLNKLRTAISQYYAKEGDYVEAGCGNGTGTGWLHSDYDGTGPNVPINTCLISKGYLNKALVDPSGSNACSGLSCYAYMKASCTAGTHKGTYLYAHISSMPQTSSDTDATCQPTWDTSYGVNYVLRVD